MCIVLVSVVRVAIPSRLLGRGKARRVQGRQLRLSDPDDGTRVIRWLSADGKQVVYFRTDMKWVCEKLGEDVKCGPRESLAPGSENHGQDQPGGVGQARECSSSHVRAPRNLYTDVRES